MPSLLWKPRALVLAFVTLVLAFVTPVLAPLPAHAGVVQQPAADEGTPNANTWSAADTSRIVKEVRQRLLSLPTYGVFDALHFAIKDRTIILEGQASRPILKSDAGNTVKSIPGVESVDNQIEVLPNSPNDDRIRAAVYRRIYSQAALRKYTSAPVGFGPGPSLTRQIGGITQDPPIGYNAIHILVKNGNVALKGVVNNEGDLTIAGMQANLTPGVFSVDNDLVVQGSAPKNKAR